MSLSVSGKSRTCKWIIKLSRSCVLFCYQEVTRDQMCPRCPFCTSFRSFRICATLKRESTFLFYFCQHFYTMQIFDLLLLLCKLPVCVSNEKRKPLPQRFISYIIYGLLRNLLHPEERTFISNWFIISFLMIVYENYFNRTLDRNFWLNF